MEAVLAQYGLLGTVLSVAFAVIRKLYNREIARADKAESDNSALNTYMRTEVIPALIRSTEATQAVVEYLTEQRHLQGPPLGYSLPSTMYRPGGTIYGAARPQPPGRHWAPGGGYDNT